MLRYRREGGSTIATGAGSHSPCAIAGVRGERYELFFCKAQSNDRAGRQSGTFATLHMPLFACQSCSWHVVV
jgi:hypothetical protein